MNGSAKRLQPCRVPVVWEATPRPLGAGGISGRPSGHVRLARIIIGRNARQDAFQKTGVNYVYIHP